MRGEKPFWGSLEPATERAELDADSCVQLLFVAEKGSGTSLRAAFRKRNSVSLTLTGLDLRESEQVWNMGRNQLWHSCNPFWVCPLRRASLTRLF